MRRCVVAYPRCALSTGGSVERSSQPCHPSGDRRCLNCSSSGRPPGTSPQQCRNHRLPQEATFSPCVLSFPACICSSYLYCKVFGEKNMFSDRAWHLCSLALLPEPSLILPTGCVGLTGCGSSAPTSFPPGEAEYLLIFHRVLI